MKKEYYRPLPSQEYLKECFEFNDDEGTLTWKVRPLHHFKEDWIGKRWNNRYSGRKLTWSQDGYFVVDIADISYLVHRVIWKYHYGFDPITGIDHIDMNPDNNRISNLREANKSQNGMNRLKLKNNTSGYKGVTSRKDGTFMTEIQVRGVSHYLGTFETAEEAGRMYEKAAIMLQDEFKASV